VFCDAPFELEPGVPLRYVGSSLIGYHTSFDRYFDVAHGERLTRMKSDFDRLCANRPSDSVVVMYTHPCRTFTARFTSTFTAGRNPPRSEWRPSPLRPRDEIEALVRDFDAFVGWLAEKAKAGTLTPTTYRELHRTSLDRSTPWLALDELRDLLARIAEEPRIDFARAGLTWLSPAEQFGAVTWALARLGDGVGAASGLVPVRELLGPTDDPVQTTRPFSATPAEIVESSRTLPLDLAAVPASVTVGATPVGPASYVRAAARLLRDALELGRPPTDPIQMIPSPELPAFADRPSVADLRFRGTWSVFPPDFEGQAVLRAIRLQTWTARPAM
jgi:hypothetical protein